MSSELVINVQNIAKCYQIYDKPADRLKQFLFPRVQRWLKRPTNIYYHDFWALQNINLEIYKRDIVGIIGRNGSGKSTLLQLICGTLNQTTGSISTKGKIAALLELGSGFNPDFTGRENVILSATLHGLTEKEIAERIDQIISFADIGEFIDQPVKIYSSGMFVRLAFAVIAHVDADILIIDEALAVGDAYFVQKCMRFLRSFNETGTLLFVSHDINAVLGLCTKALLLDGGQVKRIGIPKDVSEYYLAMLHGEHLKSSPHHANPKDDASQEAEQIDEVRSAPDLQSSNNDFGTGAARILSVSLSGDHGQALPFVAGGETVCMDIKCHALDNFAEPLVGFLVRDRLGQVVFGANSANTLTSPTNLAKGQRILARFTFVMPRLQQGEYSVSAAIGQGNLEEHIHHQWRHDALIINCVPSEQCFGMMGAEITNISFSTIS
ncbi:MAG: ABC transporter ATP-binding protein [Desulfobulbus sp.]